MYQERYESAINSIVTKNETCVFASNVENNPFFNLQNDDMEFIRDDGFLQAGIFDLTACFDGDLQCKAVI